MIKEYRKNALTGPPVKTELMFNSQRNIKPTMVWWAYNRHTYFDDIL